MTPFPGSELMNHDAKTRLKYFLKESTFICFRNSPKRPYISLFISPKKRKQAIKGQTSLLFGSYPFLLFPNIDKTSLKQSYKVPPCHFKKKRKSFEGRHL